MMRKFWFGAALPYWIVEVIYLISNTVFLIYLNRLNTQLQDRFVITDMTVSTAFDVLQFRDSIAYDYLGVGIVFVFAGVGIVAFSWVFNQHSYSEAQAGVMALLVLFGLINFFIIKATLIALWSPILLAVVIVTGVGGIATMAIGSS
ncbi:hypothetical protein K6V33_10345 [Streptococcus suis]|nr:hypothetical protein [Streptococcus suis]MCQ8264785.1 hypothetical protein [Streptococcus suis]